MDPTTIAAAECLGMALSTVSGILTKIGMGKLGRLGMEPAVRYERSRPGEPLHIDVKKLGRIHDGAGHRVTGNRGRYAGMRTDAEGKRRNMVGWEYVHIAIDDATRARLRRGAREREGDNRDWLPSSSRRALRELRDKQPRR